MTTTVLSLPLQLVFPGEALEILANDKHSLLGPIRSKVSTKLEWSTR